MLIELFIKNIAVIEQLRLTCGSGFHVLTGETGAGKSIIIDALTLIAGGRSSTDLVRFGCDRAEVEAVFDIPDSHHVTEVLRDIGVELESGEQLIIRRELTAAGKSISRLNGRTVNLADLRKVSEHLVNIHGQHEHQSLFRSDSHILWLDAFGGDLIEPISARYRAMFKEFSSVQNEIRNLEEDARRSLQMTDLYRFQVEEIRAAKLTVGEDQQLHADYMMLSNAEKIANAAFAAYESLHGQRQALESLHTAVQKVREIVKFDPERANPILEQLETAYFQMEDVTHQLRDYREGIEFQPARLNSIQSRLELLTQLKKKYGATIEEIIAFEKQTTEQLERIDNHQQMLQTLTERQQRLEAELMMTAAEWTAIRKRVGDQLAAAVTEQLCFLQMDRTRFVVQFEELATLSRNGTDAVEFLISANPGEPLRPLAKVASGGECSRIMLALKTIFARLENIPVLVFDEVDTGVSGRAAQAIAEKMVDVAVYCQVFSITHLPQVACMAQVHYLLEKHVSNERTMTTVTTLEDEARVEELARMLGGTVVTDNTRAHAREMLAFAAERRDNVVGKGR